MDKKNLTELIKSTRESLAAEKDTESVVLSNLGQALYDTEKGSGSLSEEAVASVDKALADIRDYEEELRKLLAKSNDFHALGEESKRLKVEVRNINNRRESALEMLGKAGWELWKSGKSQIPGLEEAVSDLIRADDKLHSAEVAQYRIESDETGHSAGIFAKGRVLLLAGRKKSASAALERLWGKTGGAIASQLTLDSLNGTSAADPRATVDDLDKQIETTRERLDTIARERGELEGAMAAVPGKGGVKKKIYALERSIDQSRGVLEEAYTSVGRSWVNLKPDASSIESVEGLLVEWTEIDRRIVHFEGIISAAEAHCEYLDAVEIQQRTEHKIGALADEIKAKQSSMRSLKKDLTAQNKALVSMEEGLPPLPESV